MSAAPDGLWRIGALDLNSLSQLNDWDGQYLPVLLSSQQLENVRKEVFEPCLEVEDVHVRLVSLPVPGNAPLKCPEPTAEVIWLRAWDLPISVRLSADTLEVQSGDLAHFRPISRDLYAELEAAARLALTVKYPGQDRRGLDGQSWILNCDGKRRNEWLPYASPFLDFGLRLLQEAGVDLQIRRL